MHFSTTSPPRPSLLMLVTNGPALLEQPVIVIAVITKDTASNFFIPCPKSDNGKCLSAL